MKLHRIYGALLRYWFQFLHSFDRLTDVFYWPIIDLLLWGITSTFVRHFAPNAGSYILGIIAGILLWILVWRAQAEVSVNILTDLWDKNLINLFVSPLKFAEWISAFFIIGTTKAIISLSFAMLVAFWLFHLHILFFGLYFVPFAFLLLMTGWIIGFTVSSIVLRGGSRIQTLSWTVAWGLSPFCAVYYPVSVLPQWAQQVSHVIPASYVFESARQFINTGTVDSTKLWISFFLNCIYLLLAVWFFHSSFQAVLRKGLVKVN